MKAPKILLVDHEETFNKKLSRLLIDNAASQKNGAEKKRIWAGCLKFRKKEGLK